MQFPHIPNAFGYVTNSLKAITKCFIAVQFGCNYFDSWRNVLYNIKEAKTI